MGVNKVVFNTAEGEQTLIDLTSDNVTADAVFHGATFHGADGEVKTGTFTISEELTEQDSLIEQIKNALQGKAAGGGTADTRFKDYCEGTLTEIYDESITKLRSYAFRSATMLTAVRLPNVTMVGNSIFRECSALTTLDFPNLTGAAGTYFCYNCEKLVSVNIPKVTSLSNYTFQGCKKLEKADFQELTSIGASAFNSCAALESLIIRTTKGICKVTASSAFTNSSIANGTGYVYVPQALIEEYKTATNWSTYADQFRAIEDYPDICA